MRKDCWVMSCMRARCANVLHDDTSDHVEPGYGAFCSVPVSLLLDVEVPVCHSALTETNTKTQTLAHSDAHLHAVHTQQKVSHSSAHAQVQRTNSHTHSRAHSRSGSQSSNSVSWSSAFSPCYRNRFLLPPHDLVSTSLFLLVF